MWFVRELARLLFRIVVATALAAAVAGFWALISSGDLVHDLRICFFLFGALLLLLAGAGNRSTASARRVNWGIIGGGRTMGWLSPPVRPRPGQPTLTASAIFVGSALALFVLGAVV
jgi:hypothetical protein